MNIKLLITVAIALASPKALAYPVTAIFAIDSTQSNLAVQAALDPFSDSDSHSLTGSVSAVFDFGQSGDFRSTASMTITGAAVEPTGIYNLQLGFPPIFGIGIIASDLVANIASLSPPSIISQISSNPTVYQFDAATLQVTVDQGTIVVTGATNDTIDLSQEPIVGSSAPGTLGTITFTKSGTVGPYTRVSAALDLPISIAETVETEPGGPTVDVELIGQVRASASFYVALSPIGGDFDVDGDVDSQDLPAWRTGFGRTAGSTPMHGNGDGDADVDGNDLLIWQRGLGTSPPVAASLNSVAAVPEPAGTAFAAMALAPAIAARRYRGRK